MSGAACKMILCSTKNAAPKKNQSESEKFLREFWLHPGVIKEAEKTGIIGTVTRLFESADNMPLSIETMNKLNSLAGKLTN